MAGEGWERWGEIFTRQWHFLNEQDRLLYAFADLRGEVNNGGFDQYFFNSSGDNFPTALEAAEACKLSSLVEVLRQASAHFGVHYPIDRPERQRRLDTVRINATFESLDQIYYDIETSEDLDSAMDQLAKRL